MLGGGNWLVYFIGVRCAETQSLSFTHLVGMWCKNENKNGIRSGKPFFAALLKACLATNAIG